MYFDVEGALRTGHHIGSCPVVPRYVYYLKHVADPEVEAWLVASRAFRVDYMPVAGKLGQLGISHLRSIDKELNALEDLLATVSETRHQKDYSLV